MCALPYPAAMKTKTTMNININVNINMNAIVKVADKEQNVLGDTTACRPSPVACDAVIDDPWSMLGRNTSFEACFLT